MNLKGLVSVLLLIGVKALYPQTLIFSYQIGTFTSAKSFSIAPAGSIYVSDTTSNELIKLDTLGKVLKTIGGYGWQESGFDNPTDVFATQLNVYVADKNNNRIQSFDKDLNYLSQLSNQNVTDSRYVFSYPTCSAVSNQGDLFILDSDNKRILKFNLRGEFQTTIGGFDAGTFALSNPINFCITNSAQLFVVDPPSIVEFDQFGNGIRKFNLPFIPTNINSFLQMVSINNKKIIALLSNSDLEQGKINPVIVNPKLDDEIMDSCVFSNKLFVLTKNTIMVYQIVLSK
jgi:hypothetical protein